MDPIPVERARRFLFAAIVGVHLIPLLLLLFSKIRIDLSSASILYLFGSMFLPALICARRWRIVSIYTSLEVVLAGLLVTIPVVLSTYLAVSMNRPLADDLLISMDEAIGFDWAAFIGFIDSHPSLSGFFSYAYSSFFFQLLILPIYLCLTGQATRAYGLVFAYIFITMSASFISIWFPALGTYAVYGVHSEDLSTINPHYGYFFLDQFNAVREQSSFLLDFGKAAGILTFPSVHAAVAALCAWAAWRSRILRYPLLVLNVAMALSAISHANHYLVDIIAGLGLTAFCLAVTQALFFGVPPDRRSVVTEVFAAAFRRRQFTASRPASASD